MARKKKKQSLVRKAAGLALRGILRKRIIEKEKVRAAAPVKSRRGILPVKSGKPVMDAALYHALGGKASTEKLQEKGRKEALKRAAAVSAAAVIVHKKRRRRIRRILGAPVKLIALANVVRRIKSRKSKE